MSGFKEGTWEQARGGAQCRKITSKRGGRRPLELYVMKGYFQSPVIKVDQGQSDIACLRTSSTRVILQSLSSILCVRCVVRTSVPIDWYHNGTRS